MNNDNKVYVCPHCGSDNVSTEFSFMKPINQPYEPPTMAEVTHQDFDWCNDCDEQVFVIEKK